MGPGRSWSATRRRSAAPTRRGLPTSRAYRGLRVWLPVKLHGLGVFRRNLDEKLDLADYAARELRKMPGIEVVAWPQLSVVAFRLVREELDAGSLDPLNHALLDSVNARQRVHLSGTMLRGSFVLRICVLSFRTHLDRLEQGLEDIRAAIAEVAVSGPFQTAGGRR